MKLSYSCSVICTGIPVNYLKHVAGTSVPKLAERHLPCLRKGRGRRHFPQSC